MQALVEILSDQAWHGFIVFLRVAAMASLLPAFGEETVPARIKLGVALAFTLIVAPAVSHSAPAPGLPALALLVLTEALAGLVLGIGIRLFILALQTAGAIAAQSTSLSQILGGAVRDPLAAIGYILIVGALALAVMAGLHVKAAELVILSYDIMPFFAGLHPGCALYPGVCSVQPCAGGHQQGDAAAYGRLRRRPGDHRRGPADPVRQQPADFDSLAGRA